MGEVDWHLQASEIFKHTTKRQAGGPGSQPRLLELALRCLRVPWVPRSRPEREGHELAWQPFQVRQWARGCICCWVGGWRPQVCFCGGRASMSSS